MSPTELSWRAFEAFEARDWPLLEALYHPEALLPTLAGDRVPLGPTSLVAALRRACDDPVYDVAIATIEDVDERVSLLTGRIRHRMPFGGFADRTQHWLHVFRDGLMWRSGTYDTRREAYRSLELLGYTLGIEPVPPVDAAAARA